MKNHRARLSSFFGLIGFTEKDADRTTLMLDIFSNWIFIWSGM
jgi:hypothetical protein